MKLVFSVTGMHCGACVKKVDGAVRALPGVVQVQVDLSAASLTVEHDGSLSETVLCDAVRAVGPYTLTPAQQVKPITLPKGGTMRRVLPLLLMLVCVTIFALAKQLFFASSPSFHGLMQDWMAGFFLLFGGLKVINIKNFAAMYRGYDVMAMRFQWWGYVYPFLEVGLGVLFLLNSAHVFANIATIVLMGFGMIGIYRKLRSDGEVPCACLGGFFSVPVTWVTFAENGLMVGMAVWMLMQ